MKFLDLFSAVEFLKSQQFLNGKEKYNIFRDIQGNGYVEILVPFHELSIDVPAEEGYHKFTIITYTNNECRVFCNEKLLTIDLIEITQTIGQDE